MSKVIEETLENQVDIETEIDEDDSLSLDSLISDAEEEAAQEDALENAETVEDEAERLARADRLAGRFNNALWWGLSKTYPAATVPDEKIAEGKEALVPLAEKYAESMPSWVDDFMEKPEIKAGLYVGAAIMAARSSHILAIEEAQEEAEKVQGGELGQER